MFPQKIESKLPVTVPHADKANQPQPRGYQAPELLAVGKAIDLVQGGGGNSADNNRARQY